MYILISTELPLVLILPFHYIKLLKGKTEGRREVPDVTRTMKDTDNGTSLTKHELYQIIDQLKIQQNLSHKKIKCLLSLYLNRDMADIELPFNVANHLIKHHILICILSNCNMTCKQHFTYCNCPYMQLVHSNYTFQFA
jgi:hypothetical protein